jgi:hypothetical protein
MTRLRRREAESVPPELLEANFNPRDWRIGPPGTTPWQRFTTARFKWLRQHPNQTIDGKDAVDMIYDDIPSFDD